MNVEIDFGTRVCNILSTISICDKKSKNICICTERFEWPCRTPPEAVCFSLSSFIFFVASKYGVAVGDLHCQDDIQEHSTAISFRSGPLSERVITRPDCPTDCFTLSTTLPEITNCSQLHQTDTAALRLVREIFQASILQHHTQAGNEEAMAMHHKRTEQRL
jgi:hypothetical protein